MASDKSDLSADLTIIGGGPGGYVAAIRAAQLGAQVALVEMDQVGGCCLNRGCIPTKALLRSTEALSLAQSGKEFGFEVSSVVANFAQMQQRSQRVVQQLVKGVEYLLKQRQVTLVRGKGRFLERDVVSVDTGEGEQIVRAPKTVIATGSVPAMVPIPGADGAGVITSDDAVQLTEAPRSLAVIGAGAVGTEWAVIFADLGAKVTVLEMMAHVLPLEDAEVAGELARGLRKRKIDVFCPAKVTEIRDAERGKEIEFSYKEETKSVVAEKVLMAVGRTPYTEGLGIEELGVEMDRRAIKANERLETSVSGIYAIGDVTGGILLAHVASQEGKVAVANALGQDAVMDYRAIPGCVFTRPEVASVGLTEDAAREQGHEVKVGKFPFRASGKAQTLGERDGLVKVVADAKSEVVLGVQMCGPHVTELLPEAVLAVQHEMTVSQIAETIHAHPTLSEVTWEAVEDVLGMAIHKGT